MTAIKSIVEKAFLVFVMVAFTLTLVAPKAQASTYYYNQNDNNAAYIQSLVRQINALLAQLQRSQSGGSIKYAVQNGNHGRYSYSDYDRPYISGWNSSDDNDDDDNDDEDIPEASTDDAEDVEENSAELYGSVDMNDYENGIAFFVYGEDEDDVEDVEDESEYADIDEDGDNLQKVLLNSNLDSDRTFWSKVSGLDDDTDHFFRICVEYDDEDDDETLVCGDVESFTTDEN